VCGIAGVVRFGRHEDDDARIVDTLSAALAHRGPDGAGSFRSADGRALLVHRRLAIIDPTPGGAQPMTSADGRYRLVYNGEIYNYRALRAGLEARGERFRTESDTEVLLRLLQSEGPDGLARLRGMFALALWDDMDGTLLVARDRFGIKPLYVAHDHHRVAFASEITALRRANLVSREVSPAGVLAYLAWANIPAPLTWLRDVEQLEPGTWRRWSRDGRMACGRFADAARAYVTGDEPGTVYDERELRDAVAVAVSETVRAHLVADVPVGVFLSGGIDSGAIVSAARTFGDAGIHTYTVVVDESSYSEDRLARQMAECFSTTHHVLRVDATDIRRDLPVIVQRLDQPTADAVNSYYVSRAVAATGVKAVLSGVGGDEMFGGYPTFERLPAGVQFGRALGPMMRATRAAATLALPAWRAAKWRHFAEEADLGSAYRALRGFFMPEELSELIGPALAEADVLAAAEAAVEEAEQRLFTPAGPELPLASVARLETRGFLGNQLLRDIDAVSMAHSLEVRVPFVDHELQQTVWPALAHHPLLVKGKRLLHETLSRPLPIDVINAPKRGFTLPFAEWMRGDLQELTREGLYALAGHGWIDRTAPEAIWTAFEAGDAHWSRPWGLAVLGRFLQEAP
jgi:asparagine synthase (glutamine-hydrolysing)